MVTPSRTNERTTVQTTTPPSIGASVELHPATDAWMRGDRYGIVLSIGRKYIHLRMDSGTMP